MSVRSTVQNPTSPIRTLKSSIPHRTIPRVTGLPGLLGGDNMEDREPEDSGTKLNEQDEWQLYASASAMPHPSPRTRIPRSNGNPKKSGSTAMISTSKEAR